MNASTDIYVKVAFDVNVNHTAGSGASARPELSYSVGGTASRFAIVAHTATLASGQCRPDAQHPTDVYECRYRPTSTDSGNFDFRVGTGTQSTANEALLVAYTHAAKIAIDTTAPTVTGARVNGSVLTVTFSENMDTSSSAKAANSAWNVQVTPSGGSAARRNVSSYTVSGSMAELTLASAATSSDAVTVAYTKPSGTAAKLQDLAGNVLENESARTATNNTGAPRVASTSTYRKTSSVTGPVLTGPVNGGTDIYVTVTFSEAVGVTTGDGSGARPEISYKIGTAAEVQFHIVSSSSSLASGDCKPLSSGNSSTSYQCLYTAKSTDSGDFDFRVGTGTQDTGGTALAAKYVHAAKIEIDNTRHYVLAAESGYYSDAALTKAATHAKASTDIYSKIVFTEPVTHVAGAGTNSATRPIIGADLGSTNISYDIVAASATLANGDCRPASTTPTDTYVCRTSVASGQNGDFVFRVGTASTDRAGNPMITNLPYVHQDKVVVDTTVPTVTAASSGYYSNAGLTTSLSGSVNAGDDIYTKVAFSEDVDHVAGTTASARPEIRYKIGEAAEKQFHVVADTKTLASGECRPDALQPADVYECRYTVKSGDNGTFDFRVGTGTDRPGRQRAGERLHPRDDVERRHHRADGDRGRLLRDGPGQHGDQRTGEFGRQRLRQDHLQRERRPHHQRPIQRASGNQLQDRHQREAAVRHPGDAHQLARQRRLPPGRCDAGGRVHLPLHLRQQRQRHLRLQRRHGHRGRRRQRAHRLHPQQDADHRQHRADLRPRLGERRHPDGDLQ